MTDARNPKWAKNHSVEAYEEPALPEERSLIAAILERAFRDICNKTTKKKGSGHDLVSRRSAKSWLMRNTRKPFSFIWCCLALDLCAVRVRMRILDMEAKGEEFRIEIKEGE